MINKGIVFGVLSLAVVGVGAYGASVFAAQGAGRIGGAKEGQQLGQCAAGGQCGQGQGQGRGMHGAKQGQNLGGNFVDANGDGKCDHMQ
ncbi:MAG: hypothetical protein WCI36_01250 [bacterium]